MDTRFGLDDFARAEYYVLKLGHVYESCCRLNRGWPSVFPKKGTARQAADTFMQSWTGGGGEQLSEACANRKSREVARERRAACGSCKSGRQRCSSCRESVCDGYARYKFGKDLRDAYTHYEEVVADPSNRHRGEPSYPRSVRGVDSPFWTTRMVVDTKKGPGTVRFLGKEYRLTDVHEALEDLVQEFGEVPVDSETGKWREDAWTADGLGNGWPGEESFREIRLPMRVDVFDWHSTSESFREVIERDYKGVR